MRPDRRGQRKGSEAQSPPGTLSLTRPSALRIAAFLAAQENAPFSYAEVGATRGVPPPHYTVDHNRIRLGFGIEVFERATAALRRWRMLSLGWATVHPPETAIVAGRTVAVIARHYGFWSLNACRIVYVVDEAGEMDGVRRFGFAYGTLPDHGAVGEERFMVEWRPADESVWYDLYALSRPGHPLARLGYPLARGLQRRFARASKRAMVAAAASGSLDVPASGHHGNHRDR
jgi:uncharacterized protein (UPF0548 family)